MSSRLRPSMNDLWIKMEASENVSPANSSDSFKRQNGPLPSMHCRCGDQLSVMVLNHGLQPSPPWNYEVHWGRLRCVLQSPEQWRLCRLCLWDGKNSIKTQGRETNFFGIFGSTTLIDVFVPAPHQLSAACLSEVMWRIAWVLTHRQQALKWSNHTQPRTTAELQRNGHTIVQYNHATNKHSIRHQLNVIISYNSPAGQSICHIHHDHHYQTILNPIISQNQPSTQGQIDGTPPAPPAVLYAAHPGISHCHWVMAGVLSTAFHCSGFWHRKTSENI